MENPNILIVDDEEIIRKILMHKLQKRGYKVQEAKNGQEGLKLIQKKIPDLLITDIQMPGMDGFELLEKIHQLMLPLPTIVITGQSRVEDVIKTIRLGVRDFIRKPFESEEMMQTIQKVLSSPQGMASEDDLIPFIHEETKQISLPNDQNVLNIASYYLTRHLPVRGICDHIEKENVRLAVKESLMNAMVHGNLELSSELKNIGSGGDTAFRILLEERQSKDPFSKRSIEVSYFFSRDKVVYEIGDEGPGFDYQNLPDPLHPDNIFKPFGRGIFFIKLHMDEVEWNENGNRIKITKYKTTEKKEKN